MSSCPIAASAAGTSASTAALSERLQGKTWARSPSFAAIPSSTSRRVPEIATVAPCLCSASAMAPPMPPVAPVTSAVLPLKSNINFSSRRLRGCQSFLCRGDVAGSAHGNTDGAVGDALDQAAENLAGADLEKARHALGGHIGHRLAPAYCSCHLFD